MLPLLVPKDVSPSRTPLECFKSRLTRIDIEIIRPGLVWRYYGTTTFRFLRKGMKMEDWANNA